MRRATILLLLALLCACGGGGGGGQGGDSDAGANPTSTPTPTATVTPTPEPSVTPTPTVTPTPSTTPDSVTIGFAFFAPNPVTFGETTTFSLMVEEVSDPTRMSQLRWSVSSTPYSGAIAIDGTGFTAPGYLTADIPVVAYPGIYLVEGWIVMEDGTESNRVTANVTVTL